MKRAIALYAAAGKLLSFSCGYKSAVGSPRQTMKNPSSLAESDTNAPVSHPYDSIFPEHEPYGKGVGAMPGRVVWAHDPDSVKWDGGEYWWELEHFSKSAVKAMVDEGIASLGGKDTAREVKKAPNRRR